MKRFIPLVLLVIAIVLALGFASQPTQALPEYAAQTGEPCASCHISPSGGGLRTPRGQAWVAAGRPGAVPDLAESLALLGVHLKVDTAAYVTVPETIPAAQPLQLKAGQTGAIHRWLSDYVGN